VEWNFQKYLVDRSGNVVARFSPRTEPEDAELVKQLEALLAQPKPPTS
jgi:glutathione peroxidase